MLKNLENEFINLIQKNERIIHKVIGLYFDLKEEKEDVLQEIMLQAWRSFGMFRGDAKFSTWLYKIALNTVLNYNRKSKHTIRSETLDGKDYLIESSVNLKGHELLYLLIKQMDDIDKSIMTLHLDGYKNREIADILGVASNNVNVKIHRLKIKISEKFKTYGHEHI